MPVLRVAVGLLTRNRRAFFERTLASLYRTNYPFSLEIVDNGSTDGTTARVLEMNGYANQDGNYTAGHGMNMAITLALAHEPDIVLFTADDYEYREGWLEQLVHFWVNRPDYVVMASCNLEPLYDWNQIGRAGRAGDVPYIVRETIGGSNWSFRAKDWPLIGPVREVTGGEDLEVCRRLTGLGHELAALDLAEHIGERASVWGNQSWTYAQYTDWSVYGFHA